MKILCVIDLINPASGGGGTSRSYQMGRYLALGGAQVDMLTTNWDLDIEYAAKLTEVRWHSVNAFNFRYLMPIGAKKWLARNIANYDVVHISKNWSVLASQAATAAFENGIPYVFSGMGLVSTKNRSRLLKRVFRKYVTLPMLHHASGCIAVTEEEKNDLIGAGVPSERVHVIENGIVFEDLQHKDDAHFRRRFDLGDRKIMLFIGRMDPIKGVDLMIDAFNKNITKLRDWVLVLVGTETAYRMRMQEKVEQLELTDNIRFLDPLFEQQKSEAYHAAEFVVIPSIKDAMTIIAPEAACCGKPVLITNTSDFGELARCGGAIEVDPSVEGLSHGLDIITRDSCDRVGMGQKGYEFVAEKFRWENLALRYMDVFRSALEEGEVAHE